MIKKILPFVFCAAVFLLADMDVQAAGPPGPPMGPPPCWPPPCSVPLDGGISLLIAAGAGLAGKKFYDFRKKSS